MLIKEKCSVVVCYFTGNFSFTIGSRRFTHIFHCLHGSRRFSTVYPVPIRKEFNTSFTMAQGLYNIDYVSFGHYEGPRCTSNKELYFNDMLYTRIVFYPTKHIAQCELVGASIQSEHVNDKSHSFPNINSQQCYYTFTQLGQGNFPN